MIYVDEGPWMSDGLGRDQCHAWTGQGRRCAMTGTAWPWGLLSSDVYLCGVHGRRMESAVREAVEDGLLKLRIETPRPPLERKPHTLYKYYDGEGHPLYFGISHNFKTRDRVHSEKAWYAQVDRCDTELFNNRPDALWAEREAIQAESPRYNIVHKQGVPGG